MGFIIDRSRVTPEIAAQLMALCPFGAIEYAGGELRIGMACKACKRCVTKGPAGVVRYEEEAAASAGIDKAAWRGVAVFAEQRGAQVHPVTLELLGKAQSLAAVNGQPVYAVCIGSGVEDMAETLLHRGADRVFVYDDPCFSQFVIGPYANALYDFIEQLKPSSVLVGATHIGRSLAPKVAARCNTGLTADCTVLDMKETTDLVQIRPAFGGNIMAQIVTPRNRPQFCTARYKVFTALAQSEQATGDVVTMAVTDAMRQSRTSVLCVEEKPVAADIAEAEALVVCGRGFQTKADLAMAEALAALLGAQTACTRPLVEAGWFDPRRQIGLSGRTVKPKLLIALGLSGSVQFVAGMKSAECIVAVNRDAQAAIFDTAHIGLVGDLYEIVPRLLDAIRTQKEGRHVQQA